MTTQVQVHLRPALRDDLSCFYQFQLDPESNQLAVTNPRNAEAFDAHWAKILADSSTTIRSILFGGELAGYVSCFKMDGVDSVGYWLGKEFWGKGIATKALALLMEEVAKRPLFAHVATSNKASIRVLVKNGFVVESVRMGEANERFPACEEAVMVLK